MNKWYYNDCNEMIKKKIARIRYVKTGSAKDRQKMRKNNVKLVRLKKMRQTEEIMMNFEEKCKDIQNYRETTNNSKNK